METRAAFIDQLHAECVEAAPDDVQWLVKHPKEEPSGVPLGPQLFSSKPYVRSSSGHETAAGFRATADSTSESAI